MAHATDWQRHHNRRKVLRRIGRVITLAYVAPFAAWGFAFAAVSIGLVATRATGNAPAFHYITQGLWFLFFKPLELVATQPLPWAGLDLYLLGLLPALFLWERCR